MKCPCCGNEITSNDRFCPKCGQNNEYYSEQNYNEDPVNNGPVNNNVGQQPQNNQQLYYQNQFYQPAQNTESKAVAICALVFAFLIPIAGLILSIIGLSTSKEKSNKNMSLAALIIVIVNVIAGIIILASV